MTSLTPSTFYRCVAVLRRLIELTDPSVMRLFAPYADKGIIDTIRLFLPLGISQLDAKQFSETEQWKASWHPDGRVRNYLHRRSFIRIIPHDYSVSVETEIPRVLGALSNEHVAGMTRRNVREAISAITSGLLPVTCAMAFEKGIDWRVTRLDLAVNFVEDQTWESVVDLLPRLRWPRVRDPAQQENNDRSSLRGIWWGKIPYSEEERQERIDNDERPSRVPRWRLSVYNKTTQLMQKGSGIVLPTSHTWRAELQYHQAPCLRHLASMSPEGQNLVIGEPPDRRAIGIDYPTLHAALVLSLLELKPPVHGKTEANMVAHYALIEKCYPGLLPRLLLVASSYMDRQARRISRRCTSTVV